MIGFSNFYTVFVRDNLLNDNFSFFFKAYLECRARRTVSGFSLRLTYIIPFCPGGRASHQWYWHKPFGFVAFAYDRNVIVKRSDS